MLMPCPYSFCWHLATSIGPDGMNCKAQSGIDLESNRNPMITVGFQLVYVMHVEDNIMGIF